MLYLTILPVFVFEPNLVFIFWVPNSILVVEPNRFVPVVLLVPKLVLVLLVLKLLKPVLVPNITALLYSSVQSKYIYWPTAVYNCNQLIYTCREFSSFLFPSFIFRFLYLGLLTLLSSSNIYYTAVQLLGLYKAIIYINL